MTKSKSYFETMEFAKKWHGDQKRDGGEPYYTHLEECFALAIHSGIDDSDSLHAIILHDVLEDTPCTINDLLAAGFSERTIVLVYNLTKIVDTKKVGYSRYQEQFKADDSMLYLLKMIDRLHNLSSLENSGWKKDRIRRMCLDTLELLLYIDNKWARYLNNTEVNNTKHILENELKFHCRRYLGQYEI